MTDAKWLRAFAENDSVRQQVIACLDAVCAYPGVARVMVFGSYAKGTQTAGSDLDVAASQARRAAMIDAAANRIAREKEQNEKTQKQPEAVQQPQWHIDPRFAPDGQAQMRKPDEN